MLPLICGSESFSSLFFGSMPSAMPRGHTTPITYLKIAVAALLDLPIDHSDVLAIAVAYQDAVYDMQEVVRAQYGSVQFEIAEG